jgi:3',5'-cyclic AMP phosphodiesterase CpdA
LPILDPRRGDLEDDVSSTKRRSLLALAGGVLTEINLPKLALAWVLLLVVPGLVIGLVPILATTWFSAVHGKAASLLIGITPWLLLGVIIALGWFAGRPLFRLAERNFWALNSLVVEPGYLIGRELLHHSAERFLPREASRIQRAKLRAACAATSGGLAAILAVLVFVVVWPHAHLFADLREIGSFRHLAIVALANGIVLTAAYMAVTTLAWGIADALMPQPQDIEGFAERPRAGRCWRVAHLSDIHVVGERFGFRIESGRSGPSGNGRLDQAFERLAALDAEEALDLILISGDITDAGRSGEWAEFLALVAQYPRLASRLFVLPGNHDLNIVDRANPARLDLPTSPNRRLRLLRALSAMASVQGARALVLDRKRTRFDRSLADCLAPHQQAMVRFADEGRPLISAAIATLWAEVFPMLVPPNGDDGLGLILLNSNADTHFSFTNALGMISAEQVGAIKLAAAQYPKACWIIALHHHIVEYPRPSAALSERIGTALINGHWFIRQIAPLAIRSIVMHGHRHIDWIGRCAELVIVSAPSPVMEVTDELATYFYIHTLAASDGRLAMLAPQRVDLAGAPAAAAKAGALPR